MATRKKNVSRRSFLLILCTLPLMLFADEPVSGVVLPMLQLELSFLNSGRIVSLKPIGSIVSEGEIIGALDDRQDRASVEVAEASVNIARLGLEKAIHDRDKKSRLSGEKIISDMAITEAEFLVKTAMQEVKLNIAKLSSARHSLADCILIAPYTGVVVDNYLSVNEIVSTGTAVTSFANLSKLTLTVDVPFEMSNSLQMGTSSTIEFNGEVMGKVKVETLLPLIDAASGLRRVIWSVEESYVDLLAGRYVTITPW